MDVFGSRNKNCNRWQMKRKPNPFLNATSSFWGKWFLLATAIGLVAGVSAIVFQFSTELVQRITLVELAGLEASEAAGETSRFHDPKINQFRVWMILPIIGLGGLVSGLLVYFFAPDAEGHGKDGAINAFHNERGLIRLRTPIIKGDRIGDHTGYRWFGRT